MRQRRAEVIPLQRSILAADEDSLKGGAPGKGEEIAGTGFLVEIEHIDGGQTLCGPDLDFVSMLIGSGVSMVYTLMVLSPGHR